MARKPSSKPADSTANLGFEAKLWLAADKLRNNMDAAEYKHVVLGLIFLKYISDTFEEHRAKLLAGEGDYAGANPEDPDEYKAENVFWVPADARWSHLRASAKQSTVGKTVDDAMVAIERDNPRLKGVLPKDYARPGLDKHRLGELIDLIGTIALVQPSPQPSPSGRGSHYRGGYDFSGLVERARELRKKQTPAEDLLWELLRDRQLCNAKFRRQHQFGDYLCDFYCHDATLVVECDGAPHSKPDQIKHDAKRDAFLKAQGLTVLRFENDRVLKGTDTVLFPDSFQDSTLGHIPKGWDTGSILRQADLLSGGTPKTDVPAYWNGDVPWASAKDVSQCGEAFLVSTERTITKQGVEESSTKIIPANATVVVARGATTGRLTMFGHSMAMNQTCYGLHSKVGAPLALYCNARHFIERLVQGGHGSIFDTITTSTFEATDVLLAPKEVLLAFDKQVTPLFQQVHAILHQSRTLATLRDTLLPKLLSGELSVAGGNPPEFPDSSNQRNPKP